MKKHTHIITAIIIALCGATSAYATMYADADFFGGINSDGNPNGVLISAGGHPFITSSFDFVADDGTPSFTIGAPYDPLQQGTYSSALGYPVGTTIDPMSLFFTFFVRDPNGGLQGEKINLGPLDLIFHNGSFTGSAVLDFGGNLAVIGDIETDGIVNYRVRTFGGDFVFDAAFAHFNTVPDGGSTVALLGLTLAGIGFLRRKLAS